MDDDVGEGRSRPGKRTNVRCKHENILVTYDNSRVIAWRGECQEPGCEKTYRAMWIGRDQTTEAVYAIELG